MFFHVGEIEEWGHGIECIITACKNDGFSTLEFRLSPHVAMQRMGMILLWATLCL